MEQNPTLFAVAIGTAALAAFVVTFIFTVATVEWVAARWRREARVV